MINEVYQALYTRLNTELAQTVYDHIPQNIPNSSYPLVRLSPIDTLESDTDTETGYQGRFRVIVYSQYRGSAEVSTIANNVYNALHRYAFADTANFGITNVYQTSSVITTLEDGLTRASVQIFNINFEKL